MPWHSRDILDPAGMQARRRAYHEFVRARGSSMFQPDGSYQPTTEPDGRIPYWILPAFLSAADPAEWELGLRAYEQAAGWGQFDVFMTSMVAANYVRHQKQLTPELRKRSEEHLARFAVVENGRKPCAGIYDYMFHGHNDNMPAMATRTLLFAGDVLDRPDLRDQGLFNLEALCAHFHRRGLLSEYSSGTYIPIALSALLDIAECCADAAAREMAAACSNRVLLDILAHWHWATGTSGSAMSRSYTADVTETLNNLNVYIWYVSGHPLTIDPRYALGDDSYDGVLCHGRNIAFAAAQFVELMNAEHGTVSAEVLAFARKPRRPVHEVYATTDWGDCGGQGGAVGYQTRAYQRRQWWLATASNTGLGPAAGGHLLFHGVAATRPRPRSWRDRVSFWHRLIADQPDQGELEAYRWRSGGPHKGAFAGSTAVPDTVVQAEAENVYDVGRYFTVQRAGSAMVVGSVSPIMDSREVRFLHYDVMFDTRRAPLDECFADDERLEAWDGAATSATWNFLRFDRVYVAVRVAGMSAGQALPVRRVVRHGLTRVEVVLIDNAPRTIDPAWRAMADFGCIFELADAETCGSFEAFRRQVRQTRWECYHSFGRNSRFTSRNGELQINDSPSRDTARFIAVDGVVEPPVFFQATGLPPRVTHLFPDGRRVVQRRISYRPDYVATPYYDRPWQVMVADPAPQPDGVAAPGGVDA